MAAKRRARAPRKWEYLTHECKGYAPPDSSYDPNGSGTYYFDVDVKFLDELGEDGWELVCSVKSSREWPVLLFKREVTR